MTDIAPHPTHSDHWSNSMLTTYRACGKKYEYGYDRGLETLSWRAPLELGTWLHAALAAERIARGRKEQTLLVPHGDLDLRIRGLEPVSAANGHDMIDLLIERVWNVLPDDQKGADEFPDIVRDLFDRYMHTHEEVNKKEKVLLVEQAWRREYQGVMFGGTVDAVVLDHRGLVCVRDTKSHNDIPSGIVRLTASQLAFYAWGIAPLLKEHDLKPHALEWDYIRTRPAPGVKLNKGGAKLPKKKMTIDELALQRGITQQLKDRRDEFTGDVPVDFTNDQYADALEKSREDGPKVFFRRIPAPINVTAIKTLLDEAHTTVQQIGRDERLRAASRQCEYCDFSQLCDGELYGNDVTPLIDENYTTKETP